MTQVTVTFLDTVTLKPGPDGVTVKSDISVCSVLKSMMRESISRDEVGKHIVAFLNSGDGGEIIIGAMPKNGEMVGVRGMTRR